MQFEKLLQTLFFLLVIKPLLGVVMGVNLFGQHHLPKHRQFILVANHNSHLDAVTLMNLFPVTQLYAIRPVAAKDYFCVNPVLAWVSKTILNIIPIPRSGFTKSNNPITMMGHALEAGESLIVFPEGSRGEPEVMASFKTGVAHLIQKYPDVSVIPVFLRGLGRALPKGEFLLVPFFCDVVVGKPCYPGQKNKDKAEIVSFLEKAVQELRLQLEQSA